MENRQFVYLDDLAVKSLLASKGIPIPEEIETTDENQTRVEGEAQGELEVNIPKIFDIGLDGNLSGSQTGKDMLKTRKRITDQYIFDILHEETKDEMEIAEKDGMASETGKIVKFDGRIQTDAIYRFIKAISLISDVVEFENQEQFQRAEELLYEKGIGIAIESDSTHFSCASTLTPEYLWVDEERAFLDDKEYTIYGRVYQTFGSNEVWDYLDIVKIADTILADETMADIRSLANDLIYLLGQASEEYERPDLDTADISTFSNMENIDELADTVKSKIELSIDEKEIAIEGPGVVIEPIAIYW